MKLVLKPFFFFFFFLNSVREEIIVGADNIKYHLNPTL